MNQTFKDVPMGVDLRWVNAELLLSDPDDSRECLVDFKLRNIVNLETCAFKSKRKGESRCLGEVDGINTRISVG